MSITVEELMNILTYTDGRLTVGRGNNLETVLSTKPDLITGDNFYYEPTLRIMDDMPLSAIMQTEALNYINNYVFAGNEVVVVPLVHCIDAVGNYIGEISNESGYTEVATGPTDAAMKYVDGEWMLASIVDSVTNLYLAEGDTVVDIGTYYAPQIGEKPFPKEAYTYEDSVWTIPLEAARSFCLARLRVDQNQEVASVVNNVASGELISYSIQEKEARSWLLDNTTTTVFIDNLLNSRGNGETKEQLVNIIIAKADAYLVIYSNMLGKYHRLVKLIENATTEAQLLGVVWNE